MPTDSETLPRIVARDVPSNEAIAGVIICGGGPTGVLPSSLLSELKIPNVVLEKEPTITTDLRGIALDEDGIRSLQSIGIYDKIFTEIGTCK
jgi:2-polyprenyl-6-methoxyphenol hydroxylase-like FAD-dependent oxidoreductase